MGWRSSIFSSPRDISIPSPSNHSPYHSLFTRKFAVGLLDMQEGSPLYSPQSSDHQPWPQPSRYESQKRRDWNTFGQYLTNQRPPVALSRCNYNHVLEFMSYLDQFGKTKVHQQGCPHYGEPEPPGPCTCPLKQAWGSLDALIGRLRAAYEENGGLPETNPFANSAIRVHLREVRDSQARARGIPCKKKNKKTRKSSVTASSSSSGAAATSADASFISHVSILEKSRDEGASEL